MISMGIFFFSLSPDGLDINKKGVEFWDLKQDINVCLSIARRKYRYRR